MTEHYSISAKGGRTVNQDSIATFESGGVRGYIVCDGVGGCRFGDEASRTVCEEFCRPFREEGGLGVEDCIEKGMTAAENALHALQEQANDPKAYKSTIAALIISGDEAYTVHVGDSRVYHFADGEYLWRTIDHSLAQMMVMTGDIEPEQIRSCEDRNVLLHAVGSASESFRYQSNKMKLSGSGYDAFVVCSDGFWEYVTGNIMAGLLEFGKKNLPDFNPRDWLMAMAAGMRPEAGNDNFSAIAVIIDKE